MKFLNVNILLNNDLVEANITFNEKIISIEKKETSNPNLDILIPGFVDLHVHGAGGKDMMEANNSIETIAKTIAKFGTTSFLATTMTAPFEEIEKAFIDIKNYAQKNVPHAAKVLGVHLEGPYISPDKLGAQPNFVKEATLKEVIHLNNIFPIKVITIAPEVFNHLELIQSLKDLGITVQIGHTNGTYEDGINALKQGAKSFTHLFNAMSGLHHRKPGIVGAALEKAEYSEIIPDLEHVHPGAIRLAMKCIPKLYFVSDSTAATGMPDGQFKLGANDVYKCQGGVRLQDGTLAGSALTLDQALLNLTSIGVSLGDISNKLSQIPAELIGILERGKIELDQYSDFVILDKDLKLKHVYIEGALLE